MKTLEETIEFIRRESKAGNRERQRKALRLTQKALERFSDSEELLSMEDWYLTNLSEIESGC